jgi:polyhydroxyalkanoate synthesis regulator phasin
MGFFKKLATIGISVRHRIVFIDVQGSHGVQPPVPELKDAVEKWLNQLLVMHANDLSFGLQVECRRISGTRSFFGVHALTIPSYNTGSVEIRVRPKGSDYHWACHLVCEDANVAHIVLNLARPAACQHLIKYEKRTVEPKKQASSRAHRRQEDFARPSPLQSYGRLLRRRSSLRIICHLLQGEMKSRVMLAPATLNRILKEILGEAEMTGAILTDLVAQLVDAGIVDPAEQGEGFVGTVLLEEFANEHMRQKREEHIERLRQNREMLNRFLAGNQNEQQRLDKRLNELQEQKKRLSEEIKEIDSQLGEK